jgi:hypothetical protein
VGFWYHITNQKCIANRIYITYRTRLWARVRLHVTVVLRRAELRSSPPDPLDYEAWSLCCNLSNHERTKEGPNLTDYWPGNQRPCTKSGRKTYFNFCDQETSTNLRFGSNYKTLPGFPIIVSVYVISLVTPQQRSSTRRRVPELGNMSSCVKNMVTVSNRVYDCSH